MRATVWLVLLSGCAAAAEPRSAEAPVAASAGAESAAPATELASEGADAAPSVPPGSIARARLVSTLDGGLGRFLGTVRVDAVLERGAFVGFRIVEFRDATGIYEGIDLRPGDVVLRVNGSPIERPEQALSVWNALRVNSELRVEYARGAERREIRFPIVD